MKTIKLNGIKYILVNCNSFEEANWFLELDSKTYLARKILIKKQINKEA